MTRSQIKVLEKIYAVEIMGEYPAQLKSKHLPWLIEQGYVKKTSSTIPLSRQCPFPMTMEGYELTLLGNLTYCMSCKEPAKPSESKSEGSLP